MVAATQELLDGGATRHVLDAAGRTPLHAAASSGHHAAVELLLANGGGMRIDSVTLRGTLSAAITPSFMKKLLLSRQPSPSHHVCPGFIRVGALSFSHS